MIAAKLATLSHGDVRSQMVENTNESVDVDISTSTRTAEEAGEMLNIGAHVAAAVDGLGNQRRREAGELVEPPPVR